MFNRIRKWLWKAGEFFLMVATSAIGKSVEELKDIAVEVVQEIERTEGDISGEEKFQIAYDIITDRAPGYAKSVYNLAIESAVAIVKDRLGA